MSGDAFVGTAYALSNGTVDDVAATLKIQAAALWAVIAVETSGCGFLSSRKPTILFERHIFSRLTNGQYDDGDISSPTPGGYGPFGEHQYDRLTMAIAKNRTAALQSASWGLGQIMGTNYSSAGFASVEEMVAAMCESEDAQLRAMVNFLVASKLHVPLQSQNWASFARGYNGPNYAINRYDIRLQAEFQKYSTAGIPDLSVRAGQLYLTYLGFHPGSIDGIAGSRTLSALHDFEAQKSLPVSSMMDETALQQLLLALQPLATGASAA